MLALLTVAAWWLWLGWDTRYDVDPATGARSGPYEVWQVAGCVLTLLALAVAGGLLLRPWIVPLAMTPAFTVPWSLSAAREDGSGLWVVGAVLVALGVLAGSSLFGLGAGLLRRAATTRRS